MTTSTVCRATNGRASCRVHGSRTAAGAILNRAVGVRNLAASEAALEKSTSLEVKQENAELVAHDRLVCDSSLGGLRSLRAKLAVTFDALEKFQLKQRYTAAVAYRSSVLGSAPAVVESNEKFEGVVAEYSIQKVVVDGPRSLEVLKGLPEGTPVAIKFAGGGHAYDLVGNGYSGNQVPTVLKAFGAKGKFVHNAYPLEVGRDAPKALSLKSSRWGVFAGEVAEIHVLDARAGKGVFEGLRNSHVGSSPVKGQKYKPNESNLLSVKTETGLYEFEGTVGADGLTVYQESSGAENSAAYGFQPVGKSDVRVIEV